MRRHPTQPRRAHTPSLTLRSATLTHRLSATLTHRLITILVILPDVRPFKINRDLRS